jgi:hypothetical protein
MKNLSLASCPSKHTGKTPLPVACNLHENAKKVNDYNDFTANIRTFFVFLPSPFCFLLIIFAILAD